MKDYVHHNVEGNVAAGVAAGGGDVPQSGADCEPDEEEDAS